VTHPLASSKVEALHSRGLFRIWHARLALVLALCAAVPSLAAQDERSGRPATLKLDSDALPASEIGFEGLNEVIPLPSGGFFVDGYGKHSISLLTASKQLRRHVRYHDINGPTRFGLYQDSLVWVWSAGDSTARLVSETNDSVGSVTVPTIVRDAEGLPLGIGTGGLQGTYIQGFPSADRRLVEVSVIGRGVQVPPEWPARPERSTSAYVLTDVEGRVISFLAWDPGDSKCRQGTMLVPLCARPWVAVAPTGDQLVVVQSDEPSNDSIRVHISIIHLPDAIRHDTTVVVPRIPLRPEQRDSARRYMLDLTSNSRRQNRVALVNALPIPEFHPPVNGLRIGTDGTTWVVLCREEGHLDELVLDRDLRAVGLRRLPRGMRLRGASPSRAIVQEAVAQGHGAFFLVRW
jgi:hypothetical protein